MKNLYLIFQEPLKGGDDPIGTVYAKSLKKAAKDFASEYDSNNNMILASGRTLYWFVTDEWKTHGKSFKIDAEAVIKYTAEPQ